MRKICAFTGYRSDYTKFKCVLEKIEESKKLKLDIVTLGAHNLSDYDTTKNVIIDDGFSISEQLNTNVEGDTNESMVMSMGLSMIQIGNTLRKLNPDVVLIVGDRYEIVPVALAATSMNIPVCHIQGGEISGTIDEVYRHVITKLSHIHFPSTEKSKERIVMLGENKNDVFNVGCPAIDYIKKIKITERKDLKKLRGLEKLITEDYVLFLQHPVTTEINSYYQMMETLESLQSFGKDVILIYPNPDPGSKKMLKAIRDMSKKYKNKCVIKNKFKNLEFESFINLLYHSFCLVGNSSCGIREAYALRKYVIDIGTRQKNRERSENVFNVNHNRQEILSALQHIRGNIGTFPEIMSIYGDGNSSKKMVKILEEICLDGKINKRLTYEN